jgi:glutamyl-tRNA synthetase
MGSSNVRVRFAPSPTGFPHVGNIRTALFNWLFARHSGGTFIVRIEDTDQARIVEGALESILESLRWLGLDWDEGPEVGGDHGPYFQSERRELYRTHAQQLLDAGHAYKCYCSPERLARMRAEMAARKESVRSYDRRCRDLSPQEQAARESEGITPAIRFKAPLDGRTTFHDLIRGDITFDNAELDDLVLLKSDGYPTYHLANVVDDHFMEISHVMRADEWLSSTPRHVLLYDAFGWEPPLFAHLPMILGPDKSKLSKRHGATDVMKFKEEGYLPEAMFNFLARLGWSLDDKTEIFSRDQLIEHFSIERISKTPAVFDRHKLDWLNGVYVRKSSRTPRDVTIEPPPGEAGANGLPPTVVTSSFADMLSQYLERDLPHDVERPLSREYVEEIAPLVQERLATLGQAAEYCAFFFLDELSFDPTLLLGKKLTPEAAIGALEAALERLQDVRFDAASLEETLRGLASELGLKTGDFFGLLRVATTGRTAAPPLFETMAVLGRARCLKRLEAALSALRGGHTMPGGTHPAQ